MLGDTLADNSESKADKPDKMEVDKTERRASTPCDQSMTDLPDKPDKPEVPIKPDAPHKPNKTEMPIKPDVSDKPGQRGRPAQPVARPILPPRKRGTTPPHRIKIWSSDAWHFERQFSDLYEELTKTLNQIRSQQVSLNQVRQRPADLKMQLDVYNACDGCTLASEYLISHFSTAFFHRKGPEGIMAAIEADVGKIDDLRYKQTRMANYGYSLVMAVKQTEHHIRQLAELARQIKEAAAAEAAAKETDESKDCEQEDEDMDAEGDSDPELDGKANGSGNHS